MAKKIVGSIKLQTPTGKTGPSPPISLALGQHGLNIMELHKTSNTQTQDMGPGLSISVIITASTDRGSTLMMRSPPVTVSIKKATDIQEGSAKPHTGKISRIIRAWVEKIAKAKNADLTAADLGAVVHTIVGSVCSMGITVKDL